MVQVFGLLPTTEALSKHFDLLALGAATSPHLGSEEGGGDSEVLNFDGCISPLKVQQASRG